MESVEETPPKDIEAYKPIYKLDNLFHYVIHRKCPRCKKEHVLFKESFNISEALGKEAFCAYCELEGKISKVEGRLALIWNTEEIAKKLGLPKYS